METKKATIQGPNLFTSQFNRRKEHFMPHESSSGIFLQLKKKPSLLQSFRLPGCVIWQHFDIRSSRATNEELQRSFRRNNSSEPEILWGAVFGEKNATSRRTIWNLWNFKSHGYVDSTWLSMLFLCDFERWFFQLPGSISQKRVYVEYMICLFSFPSAWELKQSMLQACDEANWVAPVRLLSIPSADQPSWFVSHVRWCPKFEQGCHRIHTMINTIFRSVTSRNVIAQLRVPPQKYGLNHALLRVHGGW